MVYCTVMCEISTNSKSCFIFTNLPHLKAESVFIRWWQAAVMGSPPLWRLSSVCHTVSVHSTPPLPFLNCNPHIWAKQKIGRCVYLDWRQCFLKLQIRLWRLLEDSRGGYVCCNHEHPYEAMEWVCMETGQKHESASSQYLVMQLVIYVFHVDNVQFTVRHTFVLYSFQFYGEVFLLCFCNRFQIYNWLTVS